MMEFYTVPLKDVFSELRSSERGLTNDEAERRLLKYGFNEIKKEKVVSPLKIFLEQFRSFIIWILVAAVLISFFLGDYVESIVILVIVVLNAVIGFLQEFQAEKAIEALKKLAGLKATVVRNNVIRDIDARHLVPGDIVVLETGDKVPADLRLIEAINLEAMESSLTGESTPVEKGVAVLKQAPVAEQKNMVFSGTIITKGRGRAVVVKTGEETELGRIARMIEEVEDGLTPLQKKLDVFGRFIGIGVIVICAVVFFATVLHGQDVLKMFETALSLAVAAVPEGLPAVVTLSLAVGVKRMIKRNALIRHLPSVETLGSVSVICTDKTGTLTCDQMTVKKVFVDDKVIGVSGSGYSDEGVFSKRTKGLGLLLRIGALCNNTVINNQGIVGDPTEAALIVSAAKFGFKKAGFEKEMPRISEIPFSSERKRMSTVHRVDGKLVMFTKGAVDVVLGLCDRIVVNGRVRKISDKEMRRILRVNEGFASDALRVLGFAYKDVDGKQSEGNLVFVGLQAMIDPPRPDVRDAIKECHDAGIKVVMITGDHKATAVAIARQLGIKGKAVTGEELDRIKDLKKDVEKIGVYARVSPAHKLRIIDALKANAHVVAMTGDGVNDAPALKKADIGVAMGVTGTDVSKEASDMILTDDNFYSIKSAVKEGRIIYDNIRKFVFFLLSCNLAEVLVIFLAILMGLELPLVAIQILWMNLITDGLPALALGEEPSDTNIMRKKPKKYEGGILTIEAVFRMLLLSMVMTIGTLSLFVFALKRSGWVFGLPVSSAAYTYAVTVAFTTLVVFELFNALNSKTNEDSIMNRLFSNKFLLAAIAASVALQLVVIYTPLNKAFHTTPLAIMDWVMIAAVSLSVIVVDEIYKLTRRHLA